MKVIGITGPTGAGKTTALEELAALGALVLDCDALYHELLDTSGALNAALRARFPTAYAEGRLNRKALGALVFQDESALGALNDITHGFILDELRRRIACAGDCPGVAIDAVALLESGAGALCDVTVAVTAPEEARLARIMAREGIGRDYAAARIRAQKPEAWFTARCDYTLCNHSTEAAFRRSSRALFTKLLNIQEETPMSEGKELRERLFARREDGWQRLTPEERVELEAYCEDYKRFLDVGRTERLCVREAVRLAEEAGFVPLESAGTMEPGARVYWVNRGKNLMLAVMGSEGLDRGAVFSAAHIDSPRLDLKPYPLTESGGLCLLKTHYYGGIRKYQWVTIPLQLRGVVVRADGTAVEVSVGAQPGEPVLTIADLLPHLADKQSKKPLYQGIEGEQLNLLAGSRPYPDDDGAERVKLAVLNILHEKYGIVEEDLVSAELSAVPALPVTDVGLDRSMIGGYGQDDRVCAYAALRAILELQTVPRRTAVCVLTDKEEIGSTGVTGMQSMALEWFMDRLCAGQQVDRGACFAKSICISADVTVAYDPNFSEVFEAQNAAYLNRGVGLCKYTGARGKAGASDASAELVGEVRRTLNRAGVLWQLSELGKVDEGGGGTVARFFADRNIDTLDAGTPVLAMHAPFEITSKLDCYMTYRAIQAVYAG